MMRKILFGWQINRLTLRLTAFHTPKNQFAQKFKNKQFLEILGLNENYRAINNNQLHRAYLNQIKKYHSDNIYNEASKKDHEEITRYIIEAYEQLKKNVQGEGEPRQKEQDNREEEAVAQSLFNKSYNDIKHVLYAPGNEQMRIQFLEELEKRSQKSNDKSKQGAGSNQSKSSAYNSAHTQTSNQRTRAVQFIAFFCFALTAYLYVTSQKKSADARKNPLASEEEPEKFKVKQYTDKQLDIIELNTNKIAAKSFQKFYTQLLKKRPHMLVYPLAKEPSVFEQLAKYSIAQDIHLYEVPSKYLLDDNQQKQLKKINSDEPVEKYELRQTKPNTLLTLSLQAERTLHNIYVKVDDVLAEIKEKGKFTPPKVFFRFYGFLMFQLRDKPFSKLQNYRNSSYISLFDLYFDYYSPIFFKRDYFSHYLVGLERDDPIKHSRYFGYVTLNHRRIPIRYLEKGEKVVFMRDAKVARSPSGTLKQFQQKYMQDWENYYFQFQKKWKQNCPQQAHEK